MGWKAAGQVSVCAPQKHCRGAVERNSVTRRAVALVVLVSEGRCSFLERQGCSLQANRHAVAEGWMGAAQAPGGGCCVTADDCHAAAAQRECFARAVGRWWCVESCLYAAHRWIVVEATASHHAEVNCLSKTCYWWVHTAVANPQYVAVQGWQGLQGAAVPAAGSVVGVVVVVAGVAAVVGATCSVGAVVPVAAVVLVVVVVLVAAAVAVGAIRSADADADAVPVAGAADVAAAAAVVVVVDAAAAAGVICSVAAVVLVVVVVDAAAAAAGAICSVAAVVPVPVVGAVAFVAARLVLAAAGAWAALLQELRKKAALAVCPALQKSTLPVAAEHRQLTASLVEQRLGLLLLVQVAPQDSSAQTLGWVLQKQRKNGGTRLATWWAEVVVVTSRLVLSVLRAVAT